MDNSFGGMLGTLHPEGFNVDFNISNRWNLLMSFVDTALMTAFLVLVKYFLPFFLLICCICGVYKGCTPKLDRHRACLNRLVSTPFQFCTQSGTCSLLYADLYPQLCVAHKQNTTRSNSIMNDIINTHFYTAWENSEEISTTCRCFNYHLIEIHSHICTLFNQLFQPPSLHLPCVLAVNCICCHFVSFEIPFYEIFALMKGYWPEAYWLYHYSKNLHLAEL